MKDKAEEISELFKLSFIDYESIGFIDNVSIGFNLEIEYSIYFTGDVDIYHDCVFYSNTLQQYVYNKGYNLSDIDRKKIKKYREVAVISLKFLSNNNYRKKPVLKKGVSKMFDEYIIEAVKKFNINSSDFKIDDFKYDKLKFYYKTVFYDSVTINNKYNLFTDSSIRIYSEVKEISSEFEYVDKDPSADDLPF